MLEELYIALFHLRRINSHLLLNFTSIKFAINFTTKIFAIFFYYYRSGFSNKIHKCTSLFYQKFSMYILLYNLYIYIRFKK